MGVWNVCGSLDRLLLDYWLVDAQDPSPVIEFPTSKVQLTFPVLRVLLHVLQECSVRRLSFV